MLAISASTLSRVSGATFSGVLITRDTVMCETPAALATSAFVTTAGLLFLAFFDGRFFDSLSMAECLFHVLRKSWPYTGYYDCNYFTCHCRHMYRIIARPARSKPDRTRQPCNCTGT